VQKPNKKTSPAKKTKGVSRSHGTHGTPKKEKKAPKSARTHSRASKHPASGAQKPAPPKEPKEAFLEALSNSGNVRAACLAGGISKTHIYRLREEDEGFKKRWDEALDDACEVLEAEARRQAIYGSKEETVIYNARGRVKEKKVVTKSGKTLIIFLLKAHKPEKYRERYEITGPKGGPVALSGSFRVALDLAYGDEGGSESGDEGGDQS
jgi:hypothetical protein